MKLLLALLCLALFLPASASSQPPLPSAFNGYEVFIEGRIGEDWPSYFEFRPTGGIWLFGRTGTCEERVSRMMDRQADGTAAMMVRAKVARLHGKTDGNAKDCLLRAMATLASVTRHRHHLGTFSLGMCRASKFRESHVFVIWTDKKGVRRALDSAEWKKVMPLAAYLRLKDLVELREHKAF